MENASEWSGMQTGLVHGDVSGHSVQATGLPGNHLLHHHQVYRVGIYGWRKRCLYMFVLLLMVMVIINMALLIWIIKVMDFSINGMGKLRILDNGIRVDGQAEVMNSIYTKTLESRKDVPLKIESAQNLTLNARNKDGQIVNRLFVGDRKIESMAGRFLVKNTKGRVLFAADENEVQASAERLKVLGSGGVAFDGSVQTSLLIAEPGSQLRLESPTRSLGMEAPYGILLESIAGDISAVCLTDLKLQSTTGSITLDSETIIMSRLPKDGPSPNVNAYQLCVCTNGRLFLGPSDTLCTSNATICK